MPDAAREIIFPQGVPLREASTESGNPEDRPASLAASDNADVAPISAGEGNLESEEADLKRQAEASDLPEAGDNLLAPGADPTRRS